MRFAYLKRVRVGFSLLFFVVTAYVFLDFGNTLSTALINGVLFLQFVPSLLKFVNVLSVGAVGFLAVLLLTILFGRVYCSSICPLGTLQDIVSFVARGRRKRKYYRFAFRKPLDWLRYPVLGLTLLFVGGGSVFLINLLDPFSIFGRIFSNLFKPVVLAANNGAASVLEMFQSYALYRVPIIPADIASLGISVGVLGLVTWLAYTRGRLYCNAICPVGTVLGALSRFSLFKIVIDENDCEECGLCELVCKSSCIDKQAKAIDFDRCVGCYNCFTVCPTSGVTFENSWRRRRKAPEAEANPERRDFVLNGVMFILGMAGMTDGQKRIIVTKPSTVPVVTTSAVSPPGSRTIAHFAGTCTACHLCVGACPTHVLQPSFLEYGFLGMMQPRMDYHTGFCNYECTLCIEICPSGALLPLMPEEKKLSQLGVAKFLKDNCVVYTENTECGACSEHCPTKAVIMVPYSANGKNLFAPEVRTEYCIGCGACEYACPTKPYKAIYVDGNPVHSVAKKAEVKTIDQKIPEEFPF